MGRASKNIQNKRLAKMISIVAKKLSRYRSDQQMSMQDLSDATGVSISTISEIENKKVSDIKLSTLAALCDGLSVDEVNLIIDSNFSLTENDQKAFKRALKVFNQIDKHLD